MIRRYSNKNKGYKKKFKITKNTKFFQTNKKFKLKRKKPIIKVNPLLFKNSQIFTQLKKLLNFDLVSYFKRKLNNKTLIERKTFINNLLIKNKKYFKKSISATNKVITKQRFLKFFKKNDLYNIFNLKQDFPYPNYLQSKSEIQRASVFREVVDKEEAYYNAIRQSPLIILLSPKPKNIYMTVYTLPESEDGYKILWKKSAGMLDKVEGQLSFAALVELFNKLNIFLTKEYLDFKNPIRLIVKSTKYYGTNHLIQNFVKMFQKNINLNNFYYMYKNRKRFEFFNSYANLINDSVFNYISSIWLKFLKLLRRTELSPRHTFNKNQFKVFNKFFGIEYDPIRRKHKLNHFLRLKRLKFLKNKKFHNVTAR